MGLNTTSRRTDRRGELRKLGGESEGGPGETAVMRPETTRLGSSLIPENREKAESSFLLRSAARVVTERGSEKRISYGEAGGRGGEEGGMGSSVLSAGQVASSDRTYSSTCGPFPQKRVQRCRSRIVVLNLFGVVDSFGDTA